MPGETEVVCQQKSSAVQSGFWLCKNCYMEFCGGLDGLEPLAFQHAKTQRLAKESVEEVQCSCAFESSKDVPDNDTVVDEVDEMHTLSEIDASEVLQQIFLEYPFHRPWITKLFLSLFPPKRASKSSLSILKTSLSYDE
ncbi:hypothetical protein Tco_0025326 [Tanacetum coccineum]